MPDRAPERARALDGRLAELLESVVLLTRRDVTAQLRTYLHGQNAEMGKRNNVYGNLKVTSLSFGITLRQANQRCSLVAYRFQLNLPDGHSTSFYRFDLNEKAHDTPLLEPLCHFHPGTEEVRLPCPVLTPLEVLDRIFLVIEPQPLQLRSEFLNRSREPFAILVQTGG
jgi:hypothetical protein